MAKETKTALTRIKIKKRTCQNGSKTSSQNKSAKYKRYRGQGR